MLAATSVHGRSNVSTESKRKIFICFSSEKETFLLSAFFILYHRWQDKNLPGLKEKRGKFCAMTVTDFFYFFLVPTWSSPCRMEVRRRFHYPVQHLPHHGPGPLLPPLCPHSYTAQLPPLDPPEATTSVVRLNQFKPPMQWRGYQPTTLSSEGICAYAQPLLVERLNLSSRLIHAVMGI